MFVSLLLAGVCAPLQDRAVLDLSPYGPGELANLVRYARRRLTRITLEIQPELLEEHAELIEQPGAGIVRVLDRESPLCDEMVAWGWGAWVDFELGSHSYGGGQDVAHERLGLRTASTESWLVDLEDLPLEYLVPEGEEPLLEMDLERDEAWAAAWRSFETRSIDDGPAGGERWLPAAAGRTMLLRSRNGVHDLLVALHVVERDLETCTLLFRVLRRFPHQGRRSTQDALEPLQVDGALAQWVDAAERDDLMALIARARGVALDKLLAVSPELVEPYREAFADRVSFAQRSGAGKLVARGPWDVLETRARTAYTYSFLLGDNGSWSGADLALDADGLRAYEGAGLLLDLGKLEIDDLARAASGHPPEGEEDAWAFLHDRRAKRDERGDPAPLEGAEAQGLTRTVDPVPGHAYLLRSIARDRDLVVLFTVAGREAGEITIAWKTLESFAPH